MKYLIPLKYLYYIFSLVVITSSYGYTALGNTSPTNINPACTLPITVGDAYIRSFDSQDIANSDTLAEESDKMKAKHQIRPPQLDAATVRRIIFNNILTKSGKLYAAEQQMEPILNPYAWSDLKLFYGTTTAPGYHFMSRINHTTTVLGEAVLAMLLVTPTSNIKHLQTRQYKLRLLLDNNKASYTLINHLKLYQSVEKSVISFWSKTDPLYTKEYTQYMHNNFYGKNKPRTNKSVRWLEFKKRFFIDFLGIQARFLYPIMTPIIGEIGFSGYFRDDPSARKLAWQKPIPYYGGWKHIQRISSDLGTCEARGFDVRGYKFTYIHPILSELGWTYMAYTGVKNYLEYSSVLSNLALRMADLQTLVLTASSISKTIAANPDLEAAFGNDLIATRKLLQHHAKEQSEIGNLIRYLQKLPFNDWSYFLNNAGKLLATYTLFVEHKDVFADMMYELGQLDAYLSFATLIQTAQDYHSDHAYVFTDLIALSEREKPYLEVDNMWNPFLDAKQAIGNHLTMDATQPGGIRNIILTGPNAGGKSTFLTGVTQSLLLAQVMGIAAADEFVFTPFHKINTYINVADDIAAGKSLFLAEVDRARQHIQTLQDLSPDEFSFTIFDEPFSGTNPTEGAAAEYSILNSLADYTNSLTIVATHYPLVMLLEEKEKNKGFANYKVYITHNGKKLNYTHKVVPGKSNQAIAIDILEEMGYDTKLLDEARKIIEHPERYQAKF